MCKARIGVFEVTSLIRTFWSVPLVSVLGRFDCTCMYAYTVYVVAPTYAIMVETLNRVLVELYPWCTNLILLPE